jgi:hypothetical protein
MSLLRGSASLLAVSDEQRFAAFLDQLEALTVAP